jgi:hypothetical protein
MATNLAKGEENVSVPIHGPRVKGQLMKTAAWYGVRDIRGTSQSQKSRSIDVAWAASSTRTNARIDSTPPSNNINTAQ